MPFTIADYLVRFETMGGETAYAERQGYRTVRFSYRDVARMAHGFAAELATKRIHKGDRVVLWGPNSAAWVAAFFACAYCGVIAVPMDGAASPDFALRVVQNVDAKLLVCSRSHAQPGLPTFLLEDLHQRASDRTCEPANVSSEDPLQIVFTSGTTGDPKG